jgi:hypothetical protein
MMLEASKCMMWLSLPTFMQTEWVDNWKEYKEASWKEKISSLRKLGKVLIRGSTFVILRINSKTDFVSLL